MNWSQKNERDAILRLVEDWDQARAKFPSTGEGIPR